MIVSNAVVVDASVAIKWVIKEVDSPRALSLADEWNRAGTEMIAPALFAAEITNVLYKRVRRGEITLTEATQNLTQLLLTGPELDLSSSSTVSSALSTRALELASQHGLPATYDAHYLALAEREGCEYWTADERLWNAVKARLPWVRWLGERASAMGTP